MKANQSMGKVADPSGEQWTLENQVGTLAEVLSDIQIMADMIQTTLFGSMGGPQIASAGEPTSVQDAVETLTVRAKETRETLNATLTSLTNKR